MSSLAPRPASDVRPTSPLTRAVSRWLADGKAQGWSKKTLDDRRQTFRSAPLPTAAVPPVWTRCGRPYAWGELRLIAPEAISDFLERDADIRASYERAAMPPSVLTPVLEDHDRRTAYLSRFRDHFSQVQDCDTLVLDFWAWDRQLNPTPFQPRGE